jgi:hypothetical protein
MGTDYAAAGEIYQKASNEGTNVLTICKFYVNTTLLYIYTAHRAELRRSASSCRSVKISFIISGGPMSLSTVQYLELSLVFTLACATLADACGANGLTTTPAWSLFSLLAMWTSEVNTRPIVLSFYIACVTIITDIAYLGAVSVICAVLQ